jgi:hypothetical protein
MRTILFAISLLIFTASTAAAFAPLSDVCMEPAQTDGHQVTTQCSLRSYQEWRKDGKLDRAGGPAIILRDRATGNVIVEQWFKDGVPDRDDGPAIILRDPTTGDVTFEAWRKKGQPSHGEISYDSTSPDGKTRRLGH